MLRLTLDRSPYGYNILNLHQKVSQAATLRILDRITHVSQPEAPSNKTCLWRAVFSLLYCALPLAVYAAEPPKVGEKAPEFTLKTLDDQTMRLDELTAK